MGTKHTLPILPFIYRIKANDMEKEMQGIVVCPHRGKHMTQAKNVKIKKTWFEGMQKK